MPLEEKRLIGRHRLSKDHLGRPHEFYLLQRYMRRYGDKRHFQTKVNIHGEEISTPVYQGYEAWFEMEQHFPKVMLPHPIVQWELSPTWRCPEDCGGCPDRASLHVGDRPEVLIDFETWKKRVDFAVTQGGQYLLLIGGTIDRMKVARQTMRYILRDTPADAGWFLDGIIVTDWKSGEPNMMLDVWIQEAGILDATTHVSADYLNLPNKDGSLPSPQVRWENSRWYKSAYGLNLARVLIEKNAKRVIVNTAVSAHNINEVLPIYEHVKQLQQTAREMGRQTVVLWTVSPWQHYIHLLYGDDPSNYDKQTVLAANHQSALKKISEHILTDTFGRVQSGMERVAANSTGYLRALPHEGLYQTKSFNGRMPGVGAFAPDGTFMPDPMAQSALQLKRSNLFKTSYGYTDRVPVGEGNIWTLQKGVKDGTEFPNLVQSTKPHSLYQWK